MNYIYYLLVLLGSALFCVAVVFLLQKPFFKLAVAAVKQMDILLNPKLDEREKDSLILKNLGRLLSQLFINLFLFFVTLAIGALPAVVYVKYAEVETPDVSSLYFYLSMLIGSLVLFLLKGKSKSDYSYWSKLLHTIILDNYSVGQFLLKRELKKNNVKPSDKPFIMVTGLARAGTTALTNLLYEPKVFHSISYLNMPFLMAPNLWKKVYNPKKVKERERAHGDNVTFSESSIEALEEYFFKASLNDAYVHEKSLAVHEINDDTYALYLEYQQLFKAEDSTHYLAKNNNYMLRLDAMNKRKANNKVILLFRDPVEHAKSLMRQNENFIAQQTEDPFVLDYMNWLGHYEFGLNQKEFDFGLERLTDNYTKDTLNYWVAIWLNYYQYALQFVRLENLVIVDYQDLLHSPNQLKAALAQYLNLTLENTQEEPFQQKAKPNTDITVDAVLSEKAYVVVQQLKELKLELKH